MSRNLLVAATLIIIVIGGLEIWNLSKSSNQDHQPSLAQMSRIMELHGNPTGLQLAAWDIPLEPLADQPEQHTHAAVRVYWNGAAWPAPEGLGISANGKKLALHTHAADGVIHFHKPKDHKPFTLRQILLVWGLPLNMNLIDGQKLTVWKNGDIWTNGLDSAIPDKTDLVVEIGPTSSQDPLKAFDWSKIPLRSSK